MSLIPVTIFGSSFTAPEAAFLKNFADLTVVQGDVYYVASTLQVAALAPGNNGQVLTSGGPNANPSWTTVTGTGTVTTVSVASANGFTGSVANATTTPAITLTTSINSPVLAGNGTALVAATTTGSGSTVALATSPVFVTPTLGAATATSINNLTITSSTGTLTIAAAKVLTASNTLTFTGTDGSSVAFGTGGTVLYANQTITLSSDVTGSGTTAITTTVAAIRGTAVTATTGTVNVVFDHTPTLVTPVLGVATATSINGLIVTTTTGTLTIANNASAALITSGSFALTLTSTATTNSTFPAGTHTLAGLDVVQSWTANQTFGSGNLISTAQVINGTVTGTGASATPTASILTMFDASKNLSANNLIDGFTTTATAAGTTTMDITFTGLQFWTGASTQIVKLPTTSVVAGGQYTIVNNSSGAVTVQSSGANTITILAASTSATFTSVVATPTTAANWNSQYFGVAVTSAKKLSVSNSITLAGTDATTMTFPGTSDTVGGLGTAQIWTAQNKFNNIIDVNNAITASGNAATVPVTFRLNTVTNNSAATLTITMTTASAVDGQMTIVRILDFSAVAQTITWVNTENSTVTAPVTSNGSTTLFLAVGFIYNGGTSKWRCIASA